MNLTFSYVDPGTGATITQLILAGAVGISAVIKLKWQSIRSMLSRHDPDAQSPSERGDDSHEDSTLGGA